MELSSKIGDLVDKPWFYAIASIYVPVSILFCHTKGGDVQNYGTKLKKI